MKRLLIHTLWTLAALAVILIAFLHFAPVSFDAGACYGGYRTYITDKYSEKLVNVFLATQEAETRLKINLVSNKDDISNSIKWRGRNIYATVKISLGDKVYTVEYFGTRYWIEKFKWKVANIDI